MKWRKRKQSFRATEFQLESLYIPVTLKKLKKLNETKIRSKIFSLKKVTRNYLEADDSK